MQANQPPGGNALFSATWHTRRQGWVQGPFSLQHLRRLRDLGWLPRIVPVSIDMLEWRPAGEHQLIWNDEQPKEQPPPAAMGRWRYTIAGREAAERVTFGMLQLLAASGDLKPDHLVWRDGMAGCQRAGAVRGLFGGPADWCPGCDAQFPRTAARCPACGEAQRVYEPSHRDIFIPCGILGVCLFPVFPLWLLTLILASRDRRAIALGRIDLAAMEPVHMGLVLGWCGCGLALLACLACAAWVALRM